MTNTLRSLLLASLFAFGLTGESVAQEQWRSISIAGSGFLVDMPGIPKHTTRQNKTGSGDGYASDSYLVESGNEAFVVMTAVYPASVDTSNPRRNLQGGMDKARMGMDDKTLQNVKWGTIRGLPTVDIAGVRTGFAIRTFTIMDGKRIVVLTYAGPPGSENSSNATRFVGSLRVAR